MVICRALYFQSSSIPQHHGALQPAPPGTLMTRVLQNTAGARATASCRRAFTEPLLLAGSVTICRKCQNHLPARSFLCLHTKPFPFKCTWCYKRMKSMNQINLKHIGFQTCLKWSPNWCVSSTLFIKMAFLMSSCYRNLQSTGQTSTFVYLYHSFLTKEPGFIKEINHLCTV